MDAGLAQVLKPIIDTYVPRKTAPEAIERPEVERMKSRSRDGYDVELLKDEGGNYFFTVDLKDDELLEQFSRSRTKKREVAEKFSEVFREFEPELEESYQALMEAAPEDRLKARGKFFSKASDFALEARSRTYKELRGREEAFRRYYSRMEKLSKGLEKDVYEMLGDHIRADLEVGQRPSVTMLAGDSPEGGLEQLLLSEVSARVGRESIEIESKIYDGKFSREKAIEKEKIGRRKYIVSAIVSALGAAFASYLTYRRIKFFKGMAQNSAQQIAALNQQLDALQAELGEEYQGLGGRLALIGEVAQGQHQSLLGEYQALIDESQDAMDMDDDGKLDYIDDWDLDNDGEPDIEANGNKLDSDAPINNEAYARLMFEDNGITDDADVAELYAKYTESRAKWDEAQELFDIIGGMGVDVDNDGKPDYALTMKDGELVFADYADLDLDNDGVADVALKEDSEGNLTMEILDKDAPFQKYSSAVADKIADVQTNLEARVAFLEGEYSKALDLDGDGIKDYVEGGDWDLDNDGEPDIEANGNKLDSDAPINNEAYARLMFEDNGIKEDTDVNELYAKYKAAEGQESAASRLQNQVNSEIAPATQSLNTYNQNVTTYLSKISAIKGDIVGIETLVEGLGEQREQYLNKAKVASQQFGATSIVGGFVASLTTALAGLKGKSTAPYLINKLGGLEVKYAKME